MRVHRLHLDEPIDGRKQVRLAGERAHYLRRVLRLGTDATLTVFDGRGGEYRARVAGMDRNGVALDLEAHDPVERESPIAVRLLQGVSRSERMDLVVQKATELGVVEIVPVLTSFCVVRLDAGRAERRRRHWQGVAVAACEQSRRNRVPDIGAVRALDEALADDRGTGTRLVLGADAPLALASHAPASGPVTLLIGPEGGLSPDERRIAAAAGFVAVHLGPRVLRTETAALAALALIQGLWGDAR